MRRKKERSKQGQTNKAKQHSTPKAVTSPRINELPRVGLEPTTLYSSLPAELPRQHSWLGPNLTSHSTPDEQANHQLTCTQLCNFDNAYHLSRIEILLHMSIHTQRLTRGHHHNAVVYIHSVQQYGVMS